MPLLGHKIEITNANFGRMVRDRCLLVDKTLMIKDFFEGKIVSLILRPRRFGKTLAMSMLQHFFCQEVAGESTAELFNDFAIAEVDNGEFIKKYQGQYPVISITFKDLKEPSYESTISKLRDLIQKLYREHKKSLSAEKIDNDDRKLFQQYMDGSVNDEQLQSSIAYLSEFLFKAYGKKAIILIDEYDSPLTAAYTYDYLEPLSNFMRNLLSAALKDNQYLEKGLMTGILRVSKNQMLSELNNLELYTLLDETYNQYFGFTENEVTELIQTTVADHSLEEMRPFYNGYLMGGKVIYNPWSIMNYLDKKKLSCYWVLTSNDTLLKKVLLNSSDETKEKLSKLMQGETIEGKVDVNLRYEDLMGKKEAIWTLLLFAGYLTAINQESEDLQFRCQLKIPNQEVRAQYVSIFKAYLEERLGEVNYKSFLESLLKGDVDGFTETLGSYLMESLSYHDVVGKKAEKFYHGFVAGLVASIRDTHWVDSNKESGRGRYDLILIPKDVKCSLGIIIEFKKTSQADVLKTIAEDALNQINTKNYDTVLKRYAYIHDVLKIGLAFCDKAVVSAYQNEDLSTHKKSALALSKMVDNIDDENDW